MGEGTPLVLVGGALQHRAIDQRTMELAELLARRFTVIHYDRRGRGASGDTAPYAKEREIEDLGALIKKVGRSASVFAMSSGGPLALDAAFHGLNITKLALYEPPFIVDDSRRSLPEDYVTRLEQLASAGRRSDAVEYFMTEAVGMPAEAVAPMRKAPFWPSFEAVAHTLAYDGAFVHDVSRGSPLPLARWNSVSAPTLVIDGGASPEHVHNGAQALADVLPDALRRTLEGQAHDAAPTVLTPVLEGFFAGR
jgi:pimeloyl-ACP methyl ester carboxylesterase